MSIATTYTSEISESPAVVDTSISARIGGLDELRGLSILWVFICHGTGLTTWMPDAFAGYGFHGVVLFFLISGYLITRILLESQTRDDYFSHFYINRFFRIWPLMLLALVVSIAIWPAYARSAVFNLLMVNNYTYAVGIEPPVRTDVMWSLAIEEQFYLFWPVVVWLLPRKALLLVTSGIVIAGLGVDAGLLPGGTMIIHKTTHGAMQYIAMGALIAFGRDGLKLLFWSWGVFLVWWMAQNGITAFSEFRWIWYGVSFVGALLVYQTIYGRPLVRCRYLASAGKRCYGFYIIHFFVSAFAFASIGKGVWMAGTAYVILSSILALASFKYFEQPMQRLRVHFYRDNQLRVSLFAALGLMTLVNVVYIVTTAKF